MQGGARLTPDFWLADPLGWQVLQGIRLVWGEVMSFVWASLSVRGSGKDILVVSWARMCVRSEQVWRCSLRL